LNKDFEIFKDYFNVNNYGLWEHGNYVLIRNATMEKIAEKHSIEIHKLYELISNSLQILAKERDKRNKHRLDGKILTSRNGLMLRGLVDAYRYL